MDLKKRHVFPLVLHIHCTLHLGTTGKPKGVVQILVAAVALKFSMQINLQCKEAKFWAASDVVVVGHSFIVYGP
jgi:acyl-coenzyme A synthetase/AMP-(fatty) acid ligase